MDAESYERELIGFALAQAAAAAKLALVGVLILVAVTWHDVGAWGVAAWGVSAAGTLLLRNRLIARPTDLLAQGRPAPQARRVLWVSSLVLSAVLASLPAAGLPHMETEVGLLVTLFFCCWGAAGMSSLGIVPRLYTSYLGVMLGGVALGWARDFTTSLSPAIMGGLLMYWLVLSAFGHGFSRRVAEGIAIRAENAQLVKQLSAANAAKTRFIMTASHDLRQPLHAIGLLGGVLARATSAEDIHRAREALSTALEGLQQLFSAILDLSRMDSGTLRPDLRYVPIAPLVARLDIEYRALCLEGGRRWECRAETAHVRTDLALLERVLRNLLDNALKHGGDGGVCLALSTPSGQVMLEVSDTGPGIPVEERERVFDEFYRSRDVTSAGMGLGLSIVQRLARLLHAELRMEFVDPVRRTGTRVMLVLPMAQPSDEQAVEPEVALPDLHGLRVLILDDEAAVLDATRALLEQWGCVVATCRSGSEVAGAVQRLGAPHVALTDYRLSPTENGLAALEALRAEQPEMGCVIVTGESDPAIRQRLADEGLPVLEKPVDPEELRAVLGLFRAMDD
ncbi:hybrid sensor histidine kinase/response regulator [Pseudacidovorax sp. RU35E]|uniref:hybrid sensor histidine kinase/response regulator n=1 Tax=Pseudacidovorax sp. RU35E TaxID=1907403 RepID=UPI0009549657|nr:hybrid sensor histidine kinase/response regulator [Pseudacidovorax sp. RU35E]SIQ16393.1 Signal transduction histidine kinase [Pseudacidovorax sp. RU35E]